MPRLAPQNIASEFPDYPTASLPDTSGMRDCSWHNDTCPSFRKDDFIVWVDWPNDADRECPGGHRFIVCQLDNEGCLTEDPPVLETDDWAEVRAILF